ncbi:MAG: B12-binding domain-containing radical SAM protein [Nitrospirae bacterium]|nr:B12-binding domain-containing radical SAM protein [Nitrospirota bacterium]MCL5976688.1 B12-binding domain-containing radical SAM protein [Nitrospirota bacterium]
MIRYDKYSKNILLVSPPDLFTAVFPAGIGHIAAMLNKKGFRVKIIDFVNKKSSLDLINAVIKEIKIYKPFAIGLTGLSHNYLWLKSFTEAIKSQCELCIIAGGHWASHIPDFILNNTGVDFVVRGEGDYTVIELCDALLEDGCWDEIAGISFKRENEIIHTKDRPLIKNLDELPNPSYELFDMSSYVVPFDLKRAYIDKQTIPGAIREKLKRNEPLLSMATQTGRGCTGRCMFCTGENQVYRKKSPELLIEHINLLKEKYKVDVILFKEALTFINNKWAHEFCNLLIKESPGILYECICRIDSIDQELLELLKESGCFSIQFGIESGDEGMLTDIMNKKITVSQIKESIKLCNKYKIYPSGGFLIGLPGETISSLNNTLRLIKNIKVVETGVAFATPYPGTTLFKLAIEKYGLRREEIVPDPHLKGYGVYGATIEEQYEFLRKYNFSNVHPVVLRLYHYLISALIGVNRHYLNERMLKYYFSIMVFLLFKLPRAIVRCIKEYFQFKPAAKRET